MINDGQQTNEISFLSFLLYSISHCSQFFTIHNSLILYCSQWLINTASHKNYLFFYLLFSFSLSGYISLRQFTVISTTTSILVNSRDKVQLDSASSCYYKSELSRSHLTRSRYIIVLLFNIFLIIQSIEHEKEEIMMISSPFLSFFFMIIGQCGFDF